MSSIPYLRVLQRLSIGRGGVQRKRVQKNVFKQKPQKFFWGGEDRYFKKVEKFELNMTGLHFVHACATSSAKEHHNSYRDSTKRQITSRARLSVPKLKNWRAQNRNLAALICGKEEMKNSLCAVKPQVEDSPFPGSEELILQSICYQRSHCRAHCTHTHTHTHLSAHTHAFRKQKPDMWLRAIRVSFMRRSQLHLAVMWIRPRHWRWDAECRERPDAQQCVRQLGASALHALVAACVYVYV